MDVKLKINNKDTIERANVNKNLTELSFTQKRMWFLSQFESVSAVYNMPLGLKLKGTLNIDILIKSLNEIFSRHEILRTNFTIVDDNPYQVISPIKDINLVIEDLSDFVDPNERQIRALNIIKLESEKRFDLELDQLIRFKLVSMGDDEYYFVFVMHHIISDGWSIGVFINELIEIYSTYINGNKLSLSNLDIQYSDYSEWLNKSWEIGSEKYNKLFSFWEQKLTDASFFINLPTTYLRPPIQTFNGKTKSFNVDSKLYNKVILKNKQSETTLFMWLLSVFNVLLYKYTNQNDICVGTFVANRNNVEVEPLIGAFF
ncbi:hypothetical protein BI372_02825 [Acinetobacter pittii]|nr:hypothetical protein BI372_02825 [Acinetobacter pittii]